MVKTSWRRHGSESSPHTISHLNTLTCESWIGQSCVRIGLVEVEAVEVESEEADIWLALAHIDVARRGGGLGPVGQVLAVRLSTTRYKVATNSKSTSTGSPCGATLFKSNHYNNCWLRQELKESLCLSVCPCSTMCYQGLSIFISLRSQVTK